MNCETATELIELLAAGEIEPSNELSAHLNTCPRCAAALGAARLIDQWLKSGPAQPPRHFTANVLRQLPPRTLDAGNGVEMWFDTMAALSLVSIILGIWFLADASMLRQILGTMRFAVSGLSALLVDPRTTMTTYLTVAGIVVTIIISLDLAEET